MSIKLIEFIEYVFSFYGPEQMYGDLFKHTLSKLEVTLAIGMYLERLRHDKDISFGDGDSVDRERVRDILLELRSI
jgi:hypothetical protein